ncbi:hypothetical protein ACIQZI_00955 [Peribacillus sp. NPDC096379]|uniref:hypothetical protein n=1 Tax=Peribacillus sp. NPDC096379 TaxID=3364393 RepID=UPI0038004AB6
MDLEQWSVGGRGFGTIFVFLLMAYSFITQLFPAIVFSFMKNNFVTKQGAATGMIFGVITVAYITIKQGTIATMFPSFPQVIQDLNVGIIALTINIVITVIVSLFTNKKVTADTRKENSQSA